MLEELLQEITTCENLAQDNIKKANADAKEIVFNAEYKVIESNNATAEKIKNLKAENIALAEAEASKLCDAIIRDGEKEAELVKEKAKKKEDIIIDDIVGRINKKYANS